jgi:hypothetical protein
MADGVYRTLIYRTKPRMICRAIRRTFFERLCEAAGLVDGDEFEIVVRKTGRRFMSDACCAYGAVCTHPREAAE